MSAAKVGLAITLTGIAEFLLAYPAGRSWTGSGRNGSGC